MLLILIKYYCSSSLDNLMVVEGTVSSGPCSCKRLVERTHSSGPTLSINWSKGQCRPGHAQEADRKDTPVRSRLMYEKVDQSATVSSEPDPRAGVG